MGGGDIEISDLTWKCFKYAFPIMASRGRQLWLWRLPIKLRSVDKIALSSFTHVSKKIWGSVGSFSSHLLKHGLLLFFFLLFMKC